jgi:hypothetical protein
MIVPNQMEGRGEYLRQDILRKDFRKHVAFAIAYADAFKREVGTRRQGGSRHVTNCVLRFVSRRLDAFQLKALSVRDKLPEMLQVKEIPLHGDQPPVCAAIRTGDCVRSFGKIRTEAVIGLNAYYSPPAAVSKSEAP